MPAPLALPATHLHTIATHTGPINALTFSHSGGTYILTGSSDRQIHLSRAEPPKSAQESQVHTTTNPIQRYTSHGYPVLSLTLTADNKSFASSSADRSGPFLWDINTPNTTLRRFGSNSPSPHTSRITCVSFTANDTILASGSDDRSVRLWDNKSRDTRPLMVLEDAKDGVSALACFDTEIVTGSIDGRMRSYDVRTGRMKVDTQPGPVTSLCLSRDARTVLVGCLDGKIRLMDRENGGCLRTFPPDSQFGGNAGYKNEDLRIQSCLAMNDGLVLSGSEADGLVRAWDVVSGKEIGGVQVGSQSADGVEKVVSVVRWREGSQVESRKGIWAAGGADGTVSVYGQ